MSHKSRSIGWRRAGLGMVVLAVGLALLGMAFALQQIRVLEHILRRQTQNRALQIANDASNTFNREVEKAFQAVANSYQPGNGGSWERPGDWPVWIDGLYQWNGRKLKTLDRHGGGLPQLEDVIAGRLRDRPLDDAGGQWPGIELLYDNVGRRPIVVACGRFDNQTTGPYILAMNVHVERLREQLVEPLILQGDGLEIVPFTDKTGPWFQQMFGPARFWVIQPTRAFLQEQRRSLTWQTLISVSLTLLAVATLLAAIWYLARLARREVALAEVKANFVADVSHELKTPLATIRLFSETLQSGRVISEDKRQEYYAIITRETTRLTGLINNILDFARIDAGRNEYTLRPSDIRETVRETYDSYCPQMDHNGFEHHLAMDDDLPQVNADSDAIGQVLLNLMSNAVKYAGDDRFVSVEVTCDTRRGTKGVLISVHDRGIGIDPAERRHLFEGFYRARDRRVREKSGTGLGLALVKQIVDAHGGHVYIESRLVKGTTFRVFLPAAEAEPSAEDTASTEDAASTDVAAPPIAEQPGVD